MLLLELRFFLPFRKRVVEAYDGLFGGESGAGVGLTAGFGAKWGWYQSVYALSGSAQTKFTEITKLPLFQCLTWVELEKEKNELENKMIKQNLR